MRSSTTAVVWRSWMVLALLACSSLYLAAQSTGGRIQGRVTDPSGAVVTGANVTLSNEQTGVQGTTQSDKSGDYSFPNVPVGTYNVEVNQAGFKKSLKRGITLELNQVITMNMALQLGATEEVVEVTSEAPLVDTTSTQLGAVVNDRAVVGLPLN